MPTDPHELRMGAGQRVMGVMDALDEPTIVALTEGAEALQKLVAQLKIQGIGRTDIASFVMGAVAAAVSDLTHDQP